MPTKEKNTKDSKKLPTLYLVVPCYNEEEVIDQSSAVLLEKEERLVKQGVIAPDSKVLFVNDGSKDNTREKLEALAKADSRYAVVNFTANYGHQSAIYAGMMVAKDFCDIAVTIDADLQQDIEALDRFIECYKKGCDVVYGVRNDRSSDSFFKKFTASAYYKMMRILGCDVLPNSADYRLLSKKALDALSHYKESNLFLRGLIPTMGFNSDIVYFDVKERAAGSSKYTLKKMINLAIDGVTSLSVTPLHFIFISGFIIIFLSVLLAIYTLVGFFNGQNVPGYSTITIVLLLSTGFIMMSLGVVGEYIGKIYTETKERPRYIIDSIVLTEADNKNEKHISTRR